MELTISNNLKGKNSKSNRDFLEDLISGDQNKKKVIDTIIGGIFETHLKEHERTNIAQRINTICYFGDFSNYFIPSLRSLLSDYSFKEVEETHHPQNGEYVLSFNGKDILIYLGYFNRNQTHL
jgi:hypothetical protein